MNDLSQPTNNPLRPNIGPSAPQSPQPTPPPPGNQTVPGSASQPPSPLKKWLPLLFVLGAILTGILVFIILQGMTKRPAPEQITVIVTPTPSPTPIRTPSSVATTSAFIAFVDHVSSLSSQIEEFEKDDPALSPPSFVLPLGFSNL